MNFTQTGTVSNVSTMCVNIGTGYVTVNGTYFNLTSNTDFCTLIGNYVNTSQVTLNRSYFHGNITGNNIKNFGLIAGSTVSSSYLLINNTYICVRGWYPNMFSVGITNTSVATQIIQTNVTSFPNLASNYYALAGSTFNAT